MVSLSAQPNVSRRIPFEVAPAQVIGRIQVACSFPVEELPATERSEIRPGRMRLVDTPSPGDRHEQARRKPRFGQAGREASVCLPRDIMHSGNVSLRSPHNSQLGTAPALRNTPRPPGRSCFAAALPGRSSRRCRLVQERGRRRPAATGRLASGGRAKSPGDRAARLAWRTGHHCRFARRPFLCPGLCNGTGQALADGHEPALRRRRTCRSDGQRLPQHRHRAACPRVAAGGGDGRSQGSRGATGNTWKAMRGG